MRLQELSIHTKAGSAKAVAPDEGYKAFKVWRKACDAERLAWKKDNEGDWSWAVAQDATVANGVRALMEDLAADYPDEGRAVGLSLTIGFLLDRQAQQQTTAPWHLVQADGTPLATITFTVSPTDPNADDTSHQVDLVAQAQSDADRTLLRDHNLTENATAVPPDALQDFFNALEEAPSVPSLQTVIARPSDACLAGLVRQAAELWPEEKMLMTVMAVAAPLTLWAQGQQMNAETASFALGGVTTKGQEVEWDVSITTTSDVATKPRSKARLG